MPVPACTIRVALGPRSYEIRVTTGGLAEAGQFARGLTPGRRAIIVTDRHVANPHAASVQCALEPAGFQADQAVLEPGEKTKSLASAAELYDVLAESAADRQTLVVAVGGGVIGDLAGFVAATYARGIPYLQVPTTLLAQVDSAVGGKVGVNHPKGKNLIGAFYQPVGVLIDTDVLRTLPDREYRCGLAEVIKYGVVLDADFFAYLESHVEEIRGRDPEVLRFVIARCCRLKADIVEQDEREEIVGGQGSGVRGRKQPGMAFGASAAVVGDQATPEVCSKEPVGRWVLNFGHTFAHALETLAGYELLHGEAVAVGMVCASRVAERLGIAAEPTSPRLVRWLEAVGLPTRLAARGPDGGKGDRPADALLRGEAQGSPASAGPDLCGSFSPDQVLAAMRHDKKAAEGQPRFVLPRRIGCVELVEGVDPIEVQAALAEFMR